MVSSPPSNQFLRIKVSTAQKPRFRWCRDHLLGQSFAPSGCGRCPLQDEDYSGSRPHSFPGLYRMCFGTSPERFRSGPELAGSWGSCRDVLMRLVCDFLFCWTIVTTFCDSSLNFLRDLSYVVFLWSGNIWILRQVVPRTFLTVFLI